MRDRGVPWHPGMALGLAVLLGFGPVAAEDERTSLEPPVAPAPAPRALTFRGLDLHVRQEPDAWDRTEIALTWTYVGLSALDAYQLSRAPQGFREANPLVSAWSGDRPSSGEVALFHALSTYGLIRLVDRMTREDDGSLAAAQRAHRRRKRVLWLVNAVRLGAIVHNEHVTGGILVD